jgi:hypothetical protein
LIEAKILDEDGWIANFPDADNWIVDKHASDYSANSPDWLTEVAHGNGGYLKTGAPTKTDTATCTVNEWTQSPNGEVHTKGMTANDGEILGNKLNNLSDDECALSFDSNWFFKYFPAYFKTTVKNGVLQFGDLNNEHYSLCGASVPVRFVMCQGKTCVNMPVLHVKIVDHTGSLTTDTEGNTVYDDDSNGARRIEGNEKCLQKLLGAEFTLGGYTTDKFKAQVGWPSWPKTESSQQQRLLMV